MENMEGRRGGVWGGVELWGGGTRERLHSQTAISRDEAFLNKQKEEEEEDQYCVSLPSGVIIVALEYLFSAPLFCFSRLLKCLGAVLAIQ